MSRSPAIARSSPSRAQRDRLLGRGGPAGQRDLVGPRERLEAATVAAAAPRPVGVDRLVAELAGRPVVALVDPAVDRDHAAHAGPEREPDHRRRPAAGAQPQLRQPERPRVVDQERRHAHRVGHRPRDRVPGPRTRARSRGTGSRPVAGSYRPGTPIPTLVTGPCRLIAAAATSPSWATTTPGTSRGVRGRAGRHGVAGEQATSRRRRGSTTAHLRLVPPRSSPRWRGRGAVGHAQDSAVTRA